MTFTRVRSILGHGTKYTVFAAGTALALCSVTVPSAAAVDSSTPAGAAADYLLRDAAAHDGHFMGEYDGEKFDDIGLNIDAAFAAAAGGATKQEAESIVKYTSDNIAEYTAGGAGAMGKALAYATLVGEDPHSIDGVDLLRGLKDLEQEDGSFKAKADGKETLDSTNQAWVVLGLFRAGQLDGGSTHPAVTYLASLQCEDGSFRDYANKCSGETDPAGFAVQVLAAVGANDEAAKGAEFLEEQQGDKGGVKTSWAPENANSTALAAMALSSAEKQDQAKEAEQFLQGLQLDDSAPESVRGGVASNEEEQGETAEPNDTLRRNTTQAALALAGQNYATVEFADTPSDSAQASEEANGMPTWGIVAIAIGVLAVLAGGAFAVRKNSQSKK